MTVGDEVDSRDRASSIALVEVREGEVIGVTGEGKCVVPPVVGERSRLDAAVVSFSVISLRAATILPKMRDRRFMIRISYIS